MATQYTDILKLALPTTGELDGTWGDVVNNNITSMVEEAIAGLSTINTWTTDSHTLTTANGTTSESRAAILVLTDTGTALTGAGELICPDKSKVYIVKNDTGQTITVKTSAGTGVDVPDNTVKILSCDGTNVFNASSVDFAVNASVATDNVLLGENALGGVSTGDANVAVGSAAFSVGDGEYNVAVGYQALKDLNSALLAVWNTAIGYRAMRDATTAALNTAVGHDSLLSITTGVRNVSIGGSAGSYLSTGELNVFVGNIAGGSVTTGDENVFIGYDAGSTLTTGVNNVCIGKGSTPSSATVSNEITLGNSSITNLRCNDTSISSLSDMRDKTNIIDSPYGLDAIEKVKVRQFEWATRKGNIKDGTTSIGFIAQELQEVGDNSLLNLVMDNNPDFLEAKPANLIPILVKAVQELSAKIKELESKI